MTPLEAAVVLGVAPDAAPDEVRAAYRRLIRTHHPDRAGRSSSDRAASITEAYRVLRAAPTGPGPGTRRSPRTPRAPRSARPTPSARPRRRDLGAPPVQRLDGDTLLVLAPADETFRWLLEAAHDVGEVTYLDRSMPIAEVLCQFEGEPATSLVVTLQGRGEGTEVFCTVESIEARPAPPVAAVVDLLELALHRRRDDGQLPPNPSSTAS
ncbi:MAG TPA: J domain-containing protein [Aquihabitans sp.]|mgnify:CR=1 FL=1|nr:J domain-containing protein [Aquihabitans sp.]